ncbi:MAG: ORF6C domain-containing protein [Anaerolineae bacterium]|nr:ORF6C domain-containing protein [Anaerolineae bacterium]
MTTHLLIMTDKPVRSTEQRLVPFQTGESQENVDRIIAVRIPSGEVFLPLRHLCGLLGVDWGTQRRRILRDPILSDELRDVVVVTSYQDTTREQSMLCIPLEFLQGFLFGINANRVHESVREPLIQYQRRAYKILHDAFNEGRLTIDDMGITTMLESVDELRADVTAIVSRIDAIEDALGDSSRYIAPEQATAIKEAVKVVALELSRRSGGNEFQGVWGELYRQFEVPTYRELPASKYDEALNFLRQWYQALTDVDDVAF